MMLQTPLISIITPSYNSASFIEETIESVLAQTYKNWEMIVVDDCSTDNSQEIIRHYAKKDKRITLLINHDNLGAAHSRNRAIEKSNGDYIAFLDSDDTWFPEKLRKQIALMQKENVLLSYTAYHTMDEQSHIISTFLVKEKVTYHDLLKTSSIGTLTTMYNAKELGKFYFDDVGHEDYVMKLEILKQIPYARGIREALAQYRIHSQGLSQNKLQAAKWQWHIYRKIENLSLFKSMYYFVHYSYHGIVKYR